MDNWDTEFVKFMESVTESMEQFFDEVGQAIEEVTHDFQNEVIDELELFLQEIIDPFLDDIDINVHVDIRTDESFLEDLFNDDFDLNPKIHPSATVYPACLNCRHFHGRIYNGVPLICGMHPHGWEGENCPDWEEDGDKSD